MTTQVPMTNPDKMLALHKTKAGHSTTWVELENGRVVMRTGHGISYSDDGGLSWSDPVQPRDQSGKPVFLSGGSLTRLSGNIIGSAYISVAADGSRSSRACFRRSLDMGVTWSDEAQISPEGVAINAFQDVLIRTSSGRLVFPAYMTIGQGNWHQESRPFVGGYLNGRFVMSDAHFFDPHFGASVVYLSDDEGRTWRRNSDGELFIILDENMSREDTYEPSVTEVAPGRLLMFYRTRLGRYFQSWSHDDGTTWTRPEPTQLAGTEAPAAIRTFKDTGHLLCVFTQQGEDEIRKGFVRTRLSSAISRNGGGVWEHFQNVESIHEQTHVEPGPVRYVRPEGCYSIGTGGAKTNDVRYTVPFPEGYGRWSYPSVLVLKDRVLIAHTYTREPTGSLREQPADFNAMLKVLPIDWFYGGESPGDSSPTLDKIMMQVPKP